MEKPALPTDRIGARFSIRLKDPTGGYRDVVGHLKTQTSVIDRHGVEKHFNPNEISAWREILERPHLAGKGAPFSLRVLELDQICNSTWPPLHSQISEGWLLRSANGVTNRANSVLPLAKSFESGLLTNFESNFALTSKYYQDRGLPVIFQLALPITQNLLDHVLSIGGVRLMTANTMVTDLVESEFNIPAQFELRCESEPSLLWLACPDAPGLEKILVGCAASYLSFSLANQVVATARIAITEKWASITRVYVQASVRGQGLGKAIVAAALQESIKQGATKAVLQVESQNDVAISIYEAAGFNFHHEYTYVEMR